MIILEKVQNQKKLVRNLEYGILVELIRIWQA